MAGKGTLSQWEIDEMVSLRREGWSVKGLAGWYGMSERNVQRILRAKGAEPRRADSRPVKTHV
jgi:hypothetical protein